MVQVNLKAERIRRELTQRDMADMLSITLSSYCTKERGATPFKLDEAFKVAEEFQLPIEEIFLPSELSKNKKFSKSKRRGQQC